MGEDFINDSKILLYQFFRNCWIRCAVMKNLENLKILNEHFVDFNLNYLKDKHAQVKASRFEISRKTSQYKGEQFLCFSLFWKKIKNDVGWIMRPTLKWTIMEIK